MSRRQDGPHISDWLSRVTIPDVYPRLDDPFTPGVGITPADAPPGGPGPGGIDATFALTNPGQRPYSYQLAVNYSIPVTATPAPLLPQTFAVDTITIDVASTVLNSVFFGYGNQVTTASGIEVQPGIPLTIRADNTREIWELQRHLELISAMIALDHGMQPLPQYRAQRVVFDASKYFLVAAVATTVAVTLWYIPENQ